MTVREEEIKGVAVKRMTVREEEDGKEDEEEEEEMGRKKEEGGIKFK